MAVAGHPRRMKVTLGSTPAASIATFPRLACTVNRLKLLVEAEWTQCSRPATLAPVSSKCVTSATANCSRTTWQNRSSPAVPSASTAATVPVASGPQHVAQ
jgi:hypothetical protein